jgi:hypothetical protein
MFLTIGNQQLFLNYAACGLQEEIHDSILKGTPNLPLN